MKVNWQKVANYANNHDLAKTHLADALFEGNLALFLGAGASSPLGLPSWPTLISSCLMAASVNDPTLAITAKKINNKSSFDKLKGAASELRTSIADDSKYLACVKKALYENSPNRENLVPTELLFALGAMLMGSRRGRIKDVWTLNYDDLLEWYLSMHGFVSESIVQTPCLLGEPDVTIYHPHGFLPFNSSLKSSSDIVLDTQSYADRALGKNQPWRDAVQVALKSKVFICVGLSWTDRLLIDLIVEAAAANSGRPTAFWLFGSPASVDTVDECKRHRVAPIQLSGYPEIPKFLLGVCQRAAKRLQG